MRKSAFYEVTFVIFILILIRLQRIYKKNRSRAGNAGGGVGGGSGGGGYQLSELELPSKRPHHRQPPVAPPPASVLAEMACSIQQVFYIKKII